MTLKEFNLLNREEQENALTDKGEFLMVKTIAGDKFGLYSVGKFFVVFKV